MMVDVFDEFLMENMYIDLEIANVGINFGQKILGLPGLFQFLC